MAGGQFLDTPRMMRCLLEYGIGLCQLRLRGLYFDRERFWIDLIQRIASLHFAALLEQPLGDNAGDPWTYFCYPYGEMRPGNSRTIACGFGTTVTTLTSGVTA